MCSSMQGIASGCQTPHSSCTLRLPPFTLPQLTRPLPPPLLSVRDAGLHRRRSAHTPPDNAGTRRTTTAQFINAYILFCLFVCCAAGATWIGCCAPQGHNSVIAISVLNKEKKRLKLTQPSRTHAAASPRRDRVRKTREGKKRLRHDRLGRLSPLLPPSPYHVRGHHLSFSATHRRGLPIACVGVFVFVVVWGILNS